MEELDGGLNYIRKGLFEGGEGKLKLLKLILAILDFGWVNFGGII